MEIGGETCGHKVCSWAWVCMGMSMHRAKILPIGLPGSGDPAGSWTTLQAISTYTDGDI